MRIGMIFGMNEFTVLEKPQERPKTLDIPFFFNTLKVQSQETEGLKTIEAAETGQQLVQASITQFPVAFRNG